MVEQWRKKTYYKPRIIIETQRVIESSIKDSLICLTGGEIEMLRNITHYLERRSTFVSEYQTTGYLCPDVDDWDTISAIVAQLQEKLMGCDIDLLITAIEAQTDVLDGLMQCVCQMTTWQAQQTASLPEMTGYTDLGTVTYESPDETMGGFTPPPTDPARCELAQAFWYYVYQTYTEKLLPFADSSTDALVAAIVATTAFAGLALFVGIPVLILGAILFALVQWGVSGSISNFINWMLGTKDEIICLIYNNLPDAAAASAAVSDFIDADGTLSILDKLVLKAIMASSWHMTWVFLDQETNGTWDAYLVPGQCDFCVLLPAGCWPIGTCNLSDWSGGNVVCTDNLATIIGGLARWVKESHVPAASSYFVVHFIPRSDGYPTATIDWGLTRVSDSTHFNVITGVPYPVDVPVTVYAAVPSVLWGVECYLDGYQQAYYGAPLYWCLQDAPPP